MSNNSTEYLLLITLVLTLFVGYFLLKCLDNTWFLKPIASQTVTSKEIWDWWEKRRLAYNIFAFVTLFVSTAGWLFFYVECCPAGDFLSLITAMFAPVGWNIAYCLGPIEDIYYFKRSGKLHSPLLMKIGIAFSLFVLTLPMVIWGSQWLQKQMG